jgi:hypothetical protein
MVSFALYFDNWSQRTISLQYLFLNSRFPTMSPGFLANVVTFSRTVADSDLGEFHDQAGPEWIVIGGPFRGHNYMGGQPLAGLSAARRLAALRAYLVVLVTILLLMLLFS